MIRHCKSLTELRERRRKAMFEANSLNAKNNFAIPARCPRRTQLSRKAQSEFEFLGQSLTRDQSERIQNKLPRALFDRTTEKWQM